MRRPAPGPIAAHCGGIEFHDRRPARIIPSTRSTSSRASTAASRRTCAMPCRTVLRPARGRPAGCLHRHHSAYGSPWHQQVHGAGLHRRPVHWNLAARQLAWSRQAGAAERLRPEMRDRLRQQHERLPSWQRRPEVTMDGRINSPKIKRTNPDFVFTVTRLLRGADAGAILPDDPGIHTRSMEAGDARAEGLGEHVPVEGAEERILWRCARYASFRASACVCRGGGPGVVRDIWRARPAMIRKQWSARRTSTMRKVTCACLCVPPEDSAT